MRARTATARTQTSIADGRGSSAAPAAAPATWPSEASPTSSNGASRRRLMLWGSRVLGLRAHAPSGSALERSMDAQPRARVASTALKRRFAPRSRADREVCGIIDKLWTRQVHRLLHTRCNPFTANDRAAGTRRQPGRNARESRVDVEAPCHERTFAPLHHPLIGKSSCRDRV